MMEIVTTRGNPQAAEVFVAKVGEASDDLIEFVDAVDPRYPRSEKWVIVVSTQVGCPVGCMMCDSGTYFKRNLSFNEIFAQIDHVVRRWFSDGNVLCPKFKVQFARMGEPSLNKNVIDVIRELPKRYVAPGLLPCVATVMPKNSVSWFHDLLSVVHAKYEPGRFQLQISINSTDEKVRDRLIPIEKWSWMEINRYGKRFVRKGDRKIALNFALPKDTPVDAMILREFFDPEYFLVKLTPVNPTEMAKTAGLDTILSNECPDELNNLAKELSDVGFETIVSIGSDEEIDIGSNCGQSVKHYLSTISAT